MLSGFLINTAPRKSTEDERGSLVELLELMRRRRSIRKYSGEHIADESLEKILQAGLLAPSSRAIYPVELVVTREKSVLEKLSDCKAGAAKMLADADAAVVVVGDTEKSDAWIEDCSLSMMLMQLEASELGVGSCWVQCRGRKTPDGESTEVYIRKLMNIPEHFGVLAVLALGIPAQEIDAHPLPCTDCEKVHHGSF